MKTMCVKVILLPLLFLLPLFAEAQYFWNKENMAVVKNRLDDPIYEAALERLFREADEALEHEPYSVTFKEKLAPSGDKHDYLSQARYYWPDPKKADGRPYVNRDGHTNPEIEKLDRIPLGNLAGDVNTLALAYYFSGEERYAAKATELLRVWFLNPETKMNPHMKYAQVVWGRNNDMGRSFGIIDTYSFVEMLNGMALLEKSLSFTKSDKAELQSWFSAYLDWMLTSQSGIEESQQSNNHSIAYDVQVVAYAVYTGREDVALAVINSFPDRRLYAQIEPDGSQPRELARTLAFHYSQYNIRHMIEMAEFAISMGKDVHTVESLDGRGMYKAVDFLIPYLGKTVEEWPYQQLDNWENKQKDFAEDVFRVYLLDGSRTEYLDVARKYWKQSDSDRSRLIFGVPSSY